MKQKIVNNREFYGEMTEDQRHFAAAMANGYCPVIITSDVASLQNVEVPYLIKYLKRNMVKLAAPAQDLANQIINKYNEL